MLLIVVFVQTAAFRCRSCELAAGRYFASSSLHVMSPVAAHIKNYVCPAECGMIWCDRRRHCSPLRLRGRSRLGSECGCATADRSFSGGSMAPEWPFVSSCYATNSLSSSSHRSPVFAVDKGADEIWLRTPDLEVRSPAIPEPK